MRRNGAGVVAAAGTGVVGLAASAVWAAWLGRDDRYQADPVTRIASGPYETWQVVGAGLSLTALVVGALVVGLPPPYAGGAVTLGFTAAWTAHAAREDASGLFMVGASMLVAGLSIGCTVVSALTLAALRRTGRGADRTGRGGPVDG